MRHNQTWICPLCGYGCGHDFDALDEDTLDRVARHEAGHAVMRWLRGLPQGPLCIHTDGSGLCDTPAPGGVSRTEDMLLITMAGPVAEVGYLNTIDFAASQGGDVDALRELLTPTYLHGWLSGRFTVAEALAHYAAWTRDILCNYMELVEWIAERLREAYCLPADDVQRMIDMAYPSQEETS